MIKVSNKILMVVTVRHFFIGLGLALHDKKHDYHLVFINQNHGEELNPILRAAMALVAPFKTVRCMPLNSSGGASRYKTRKKIFYKLEQLIKELCPVEISTGNDRRIEFQYAMHFARGVLGYDVVGSYLDNGNGSYISYEKLNLRKYLSRIWIDVLVKKIAYGRWFTTAYKYGDSHWIDKCYLCHLDHIPDHLAEKKSSEVELRFYRTENAKIVLSKYVEHLGLPHNINKPSDSMLMVLPRVKMIADIYGSLEEAKAVIADISEEYENVFIKYHPADTLNPLGFDQGVTILPSSIPVEMLLGVMEFDYILGDTSTAIMAAKWMFPNSRVEFIDTGSPYTLSIKKLYMSMGILPFDPRESLV